MKNDRTNARNASNGEQNSHPSHASHPSHLSHPPDRILPPRGDYQTLLSFHKAEVVYDITFRFAHKFLSKGDRTIDQMIQSARSGKKNILEGSKAALSSKETEIKLTNVARASLEELLADYRDFLRVRDLPLWAKDSKQARFVPPNRQCHRPRRQWLADCLARPTHPSRHPIRLQAEGVRRLDPLGFLAAEANRAHPGEADPRPRRLGGKRRLGRP